MTTTLRYATVSQENNPPSIRFPDEYNAACDFVDRHVEAGRGARIALVDDAGEYSYADLAERINRAGNAFKGLGLAPESRLMMCVLDGVDFAAAFFGAIKAGLVPIPVNTMLRPADYAEMLEDSRAPALLVSAPLLAALGPILDGARHLHHILVSCDGTVRWDDQRRPGVISSFRELCERASKTLEPAVRCADDVAFWLYTSGSTGTPKGAMHLHRDLVTTAVLYGVGMLGIVEDDRTYSAAKLFFAYGLGNGLSFPLYVGATSVVMAERPTPDAVMNVLRSQGITIFYGVPTLYGAMLAAPARDPGPDDATDAALARSERRSKRGPELDKLRLCVSAGEALPTAIGEAWEQRFGCEVLDGLGSTEMLHIFLSNQPGNVRYGASGVPVPGYKLRVLGEGGQEVEDGEVGELWVNGGSSAVAYWNKRERSLDTFHGPWTRTGDKYTRDVEGVYFYAGRTDDMLKVSGQWVSPFEVESALLEDDRVVEAAVVGAKDDNGMVKPRAVVVLRAGVPDGDETANALRDGVKQRLAPHKYPRWIDFVPVLPKTATGKIQRYKLRD